RGHICRVSPMESGRTCWIIGAFQFSSAIRSLVWGGSRMGVAGTTQTRTGTGLTHAMGRELGRGGGGTPSRFLLRRIDPITKMIGTFFSARELEEPNFPPDT